MQKELERKTELLKGICSKYDTSEFFQIIGATLLQTSKRDDNPILKKLFSPFRQLFYLASLNLQSTNIQSEKVVSKNDWNNITDLLHEIELEYFYMIGFPKKGEESSEEIEKIKAVLPTFMNFFCNGELSYQEQEIEKIENVFVHFKDKIKEKLNVEPKDFVNLFDFINEEINKRLNDAIKFYNSETWQKFTEKCLEKGLDDPKDWITEKEMDLPLAFLRNPGTILIIDTELINKTAATKEKFLLILNLLSCTNKPNNEIVYYTDKNILLEKPIFKIDEKHFLIFYSKQILNASYNLLLNTCLKIDSTKIYTHRDLFVEQKTYKIFQEFFDDKAHLYKNYYVDINYEQDILLVYKSLVLIIEVKANSYRAPLRDPLKAYEKLKSDFKKNIQYGYDQTQRIKNKFKGMERFQIRNARDQILMEINPNKYSNVFSIIVTLEKFGNIQTDLEQMLETESKMDYPWAVNIDDLEVFLLALRKRKNKIQSLISFLIHRQLYHGHLICSDELEMCGFFLGNESKFMSLSNRKEKVLTKSDNTEPIEKEYRNGLGFPNERYLNEKRNKTAKFIFAKE